MKSIFAQVVFTMIFLFFPLTMGSAQEILPNLKKILVLVSKKLQNPTPFEKRQNHYHAKELYYRILSNRNQLDVVAEVKSYFEKAINKAETKFNEGDDSVSQSDVTKLKLGLSGVLNDIIELQSEIDRSRISLEIWIGKAIPTNFDMEEKKINPLDFPTQKWKDYLKARVNSFKHKTSNETPLPDLLEVREKYADWHKAFIQIKEARGKMKLAENAKKITRALLITEVANSDFGIGNSGDLFEALIIYTRVLRGFFQTIFNFNMAVAAFEKLGPLD